MIELVVATAIFSMGLGSLSLLLLASVQGTAEARHRTVATTHAESLAEMIALQSDAYGHDVFGPSAAAAAVCNGVVCQNPALAGDELESWREQLARELPGASGLVCRDRTPDDGNVYDPACDGGGALVTKVFWTESRHEQDEDRGERRVVARLPW